ncbi:MAG TPA: DPP IV N-terminal domain-containing protein [Longimicrobiales bacterium]
MRYRSSTPILLAVSALVPLSAAAQDVMPWAPSALTAADYARAEQYLPQFTDPLVTGGVVRPTWLADGRFWYRSTAGTGEDYVLVDPARRTRTTASSPAGLGVAQPAPGARGRAESVSPDGRTAVFIREHNLWAREIATGRETQLTTDGVEDYGYATNNAGWTRSDAPVVAWSPDSRRVATFQHDGRGVSEMYLVHTGVGAPTLDAWKYPLPGDSVIFRISRVIIDLDGPRVVRLQMPPDPHRSTLCDHVVCRGAGWVDVEWTSDSRRLAFASVSRDHRDVTLRIADAETGVVRDILTESVPTYFESGNGRVNWRVLTASNEVIWFSERDDWGHLYLYDLRTGALKNRITSGSGNVMQILRIDEAARRIYFLGLGREEGRDPYFRHLYRVSFDGSGLTLLTPEDADHDVSLSPDGRFFVDNFSRPDVPVTSVLRNADGRLVLELERMDVSRLRATGWTPPIPFTVKARDGRTDLYGLMYRPSHFDSTKAYPIINNIYPGPQTGSVRSRSFTAARGDTRAIAELGFIVVQIDGMGTPGRSKRFHDAWYGNMGDNTLPDQVTGMQQLAERHAWIDIERAGIYGHSGGGNATAAAMFQYPDLFKVGVAQAGNHDNRIYEDDWAEKWQGLLVQNADGTTNYDNQANQLLAGNLKGKLLLAHGTLDSNVPPYSTLLVVNELIRHNKDFDLIMLPNRGHGFGNEPYMMRRRWDYFVKHLLGAEPPPEYRMGRLSTAP